MVELKVPELTQEENNRRLLFIGKCVDTNALINNPTKFGVNQTLTVQDLSQSNTSTLEQIYISIQKVVNEASLGLNPKGEVLYSGISASEWMDFIKLTVQKKAYDLYILKKNKRVKEIEDQLENMKSPSQKKRDLQGELLELK